MVMGPTPPGNGCDGAGDLARLLEGDIADHARFAGGGVRDAVDADVDDDGARFEPVAAHEVRSAHGCDDDVGAAALLRQIPRARVCDGNRAVCLQEELQHGFADDVGATDNDGVLPRQVA